MNATLNPVRPARKDFLGRLFIYPIQKLLVDGDCNSGFGHRTRGEYDRVVLSMKYDYVILVRTVLHRLEDN